MRVNGTYRIEVPRDRLWEALMDPDVVGQCIPGVQKFTTVSPDNYEMDINVKVGVFSGSFNGTLEVLDKDAPISYRMAVRGAGPMTNVSGEAAVSLEPDDDATLLTFDGDVRVTGALARVGQRFMSSAAKSQFDAFFQRLRDNLA